MSVESPGAETAARRAQLARLLRLHNSIQHYAWGSREALARLSGREPSSEPEAELWIGAHPKAPSQVDGGEWRLSLPQLLALRPVELLGAPAVRRDGPSLPFLLKILAASEPLSVQAHPDRERARLGFASEREAGVDLESPERCYPDPNPKRELVIALSQFPVLSGFRPRQESLRLLAALDLEEVAPLLVALERGPPSLALRELLRALLAGSEEERLGLAAAAAERAAGFEPLPYRWVTRLARRYPRDPVILAPLFLELIELQPGEALFTDCGILHSYLGGTAVELMTNSDNVLRAGLTPKPVHRDRLLEVVRFEEGPGAVLAPERPGEGIEVYRSPAHDLRLERLDLAAAGSVQRGVQGLELVLCTGGSLVAEWAGGRQELHSGEALLAPAVLDDYRLSGSAVAFRASS